MRDSAAGRGESAGLDDEDPDMDGWSDMDDDDSDDDSGDGGGKSFGRLAHGSFSLSLFFCSSFFSHATYTSVICLVCIRSKPAKKSRCRGIAVKRYIVTY